MCYLALIPLTESILTTVMMNFNKYYNVEYNNVNYFTRICAQWAVNQEGINVTMNCQHSFLNNMIDLFEFAHAKDLMTEPVNTWRSHLHTTFSIEACTVELMFLREKKYWAININSTVIPDKSGLVSPRAGIAVGKQERESSSITLVKLSCVSSVYIAGRYFSRPCRS